jgi:hypothetical protein
MKFVPLRFDPLCNLIHFTICFFVICNLFYIIFKISISLQFVLLRWRFGHFSLFKKFVKDGFHHIISIWIKNWNFLCLSFPVWMIVIMSWSWLMIQIHHICVFDVSVSLEWPWQWLFQNCLWLDVRALTAAKLADIKHSVNWDPRMGCRKRCV